MPAVKEDLMLQAMIVSAKGKTNRIAYWSRLPDWKRSASRRASASAPMGIHRALLTTAAREAKWFDARYDQGFPRFYEGSRWALPARFRCRGSHKYGNMVT
jgi:hypothetical protein